MFLSKKNAIYFNKPKVIDSKKPKRILPGWDDEDQEKKQKYQFTSTKTETKQLPNNLLQGEDFNDLTAELQNKKQAQNKFYLNWDELNQKTDIQCEKRLVQEIVQPGGIRIKPNDTMLNDFLKQIKGMEVHTIGSLLLSKIQVNYPFQTKAKALYTIEFLVKKNEVYLSFFKAHYQKLKEFPEPEDNVDNYKKILKSVLSIIGVPVETSNTISEQSKQKYVDPGYNDDPKFLMSNFIQQNAPKAKKPENKKVIIGPGQLKQKAETKPQPENNFLNLDLLSSGSNGNQGKPRVEQGAQIPQQQLSFEQMMSGISLGSTSQPQRNVNNMNFLI